MRNPSTSTRISFAFTAFSCVFNLSNLTGSRAAYFLFSLGTDLPTYIYTQMHAYMYIQMCVCVLRVCVCVCVCVCV